MTSAVIASMYLVLLVVAVADVLVTANAAITCDDAVADCATSCGSDDTLALHARCHFLILLGTSFSALCVACQVMPPSATRCALLRYLS